MLGAHDEKAWCPCVVSMLSRRSRSTNMKDITRAFAPKPSLTKCSYWHCRYMERVLDRRAAIPRAHGHSINSQFQVDQLGSHSELFAGKAFI